MSIAGWLPADWRKAVVPIAVRAGGNFAPVGTAFLIEHQGFNCLVTAKHVVFEDSGQLRNGLFVLSNRIGGGGNFLPCDELTRMGASWKTLEGCDIAATLMPADTTHDLRRFAATLFENFSNVREGDDIFFLGFPLSLGVSPTARITPIVRAGMVALKNDDRSFLIEANAFPGNSGSPVFFRPCPFEFSADGLRMGTVRPPKLIGMLTSFVPYEDEAVSRQTGRTRVTFEENSGLASALSIEFVSEILNSESFQSMTRAIVARERGNNPPPT